MALFGAAAAAGRHRGRPDPFGVPGWECEGAQASTLTDLNGFELMLIGVNWPWLPGGCGDMYEIHVESEEFREKRPVQQHRMVTQRGDGGEGKGTAGMGVREWGRGKGTAGIGERE
uniref:Uncharacterized protein n=1 Tax=Zonotrichia albicollis TaxID=44394 RepID=A0A8D2M0T5_ZONAL